MKRRKIFKEGYKPFLNVWSLNNKVSSMKHILSRYGSFEEDLKEITNQVPVSCLDRLQNQLRRLVEDDFFTTVQFLSHGNHSTTPYPHRHHFTASSPTVYSHFPNIHHSIASSPTNTILHPPHRHHFTTPSPTDTILQPHPLQTPFYSPFLHRHNFEAPLPPQTPFYSPFTQQLPFYSSQSLPHMHHSTTPYSTDIILLPLPHRHHFINPFPYKYHSTAPPHKHHSTNPSPTDTILHPL